MSDLQAVNCMDFGYAFPFEGNWNFKLDVGGCFAKTALDTLSRLKGIETGRRLGLGLSSYDALDTLSRLKGIETRVLQKPSVYRWSPLDTLSRLKGIETGKPRSLP